MISELCRPIVTSKNIKKVKRYLENFDKVNEKLLEVERKRSIAKFSTSNFGAKRSCKAFNLGASKIC